MLEVNASSDRTGAHLLRLVGEATQSRRLAHLAHQAQAQAQASQKGPAKAQVRHPAVTWKVYNGRGSVLILMVLVR